MVQEQKKDQKGDQKRPYITKTILISLEKSEYSRLWKSMNTSIRRKMSMYDSNLSKKEKQSTNQKL